MGGNQVWNPEQYNRFREERARPFYDLVALIQGRGFRRAVDLGCGTGELTAQLRERAGIADLLAVDSSSAMIAKAKPYERGGLRFRLEKIEDTIEKTMSGTGADSAKFDLVFSNAALQWIPNHEVLFPNVLSLLNPGGEVAIQMPSNHDHPSHRIAIEVAHELFPSKFPNPKAVLAPILSLERYAEILHASGFKNQSCRLQIYGASMNSGSDVVEWTRGTFLTIYEAALEPIDFGRFVAEYRKRLVHRIGDGAYFFGFKRFLLWGKKST